MGVYVDGERLTDASLWAAGPSGRLRRLVEANDVRDLERDHPAWDHVVFVGPAEATAGDARSARREMRALMLDAGPALVHGGVELAGGWRTTYADARTAAGETVAFTDRRDALLAGLRRVGVEGVAALGPRSSVLVGLLGPQATTRVGVALAGAVEDGRWEAVTLASATSDLLGPERVEAVLAFEAVGPMAPEPWSATLAAGRLRAVIGRYPEPRRLSLLTSLWATVAEVAAVTAERERRRSYLPALRKEGRLARLRAQRDAVDDFDVVEAARAAVGRDPLPTDIFRLHPYAVVWRWLDRAVGEAARATVLLRLAAADRDGRLADALLDHTAVLEALAPGLHPFPSHVDLPEGLQRTVSAHRLVTNIWSTLQVATRPSRRSSGVDGVRVESGDPLPAVRRFLASALDLAEVALLDVAKAVAGVNRNLFGWSPGTLPNLNLEFRAVLPVELQRLAAWNQRFALVDPAGSPLNWAPTNTLHEAAAAAEPRAEHVLDGIWLGDLLDAMAELHGRDGAEVEIGDSTFHYAVEPPVADEPDPLQPVAASLPGAIAAAAQLVELGGHHPDKPRSWPVLTQALHDSLDVETWLAGDFRVPRAFRDANGTTLPGTELTIQVATGARTLADWGRHMGNCIATYADDGRRGRSVLIGLYEGDELRHNLEVRRGRSRWLLSELQARFNEDSPAEVCVAVDAWLEELTRADLARRGATATGVRPPGGIRRGRGPRRRPSPAQTRAAEAELAAAAETVLAAAEASGARAAAARSTVAIEEVCASGGASDLAALLATDATARAVALVGADHLAVLAGLERLLAVAAGARHLAVPRRLVRIEPLAATVELGWARHRAAEAVAACLVGASPALPTMVSSDRSLGGALILARVALSVPAGPVVAVRPKPDGTLPGYPPADLFVGEPWDTCWWAAAAVAPSSAELRAAMRTDLAAGHDVVLEVPTTWLGRGGWAAWWRRVNR